MKKRLKLTLDVTYNTPKKHVETLVRNMEYMATHAMGEGLLTLDAEEATVDTHDVRISSLPYAKTRPPKQTGDVDILKTIIEGMARALFVSAYADYCDSEGADPNLPIATCGTDWMDVAPATPQYAIDAANRLLGKFEERNHRSIWVLLAKAVEADELPVDHSHRDAEYVRLFGHYLAMGALGHGVSWFDDHEEFPLEFPYIEFELEDVDLLLKS